MSDIAEIERALAELRSMLPPPITDPDFERTLDADAEAWDVRRVYADWLDEHGNAEYAFAQRWMTANEKRPSKPRSIRGEDWWSWWSSGSIDPRSVIVEGIYVHLAHMFFYNRTAAELDLAQALKKCGLQ